MTIESENPCTSGLVAMMPSPPPPMICSNA